MATVGPERPKWLSIVAGGLSGTTVDLVLFPLDTIKTRMQASRAVAAASVRASGRSFYAGLGAAVAASFPAAAAFWTVYEAAKKAAAGAVGSPDHAVVPLVAAAAADVVVCGIRNPFEVVKQQLQVGLHRTTGDAVRAVVKADGFAGLYAGYVSMLTREVPFDALQLLLYERMKLWWRRRVDRDLVLADNMALGSVAGALSAFATTPLDVAKTRLMTQSSTPTGARYSGVVGTLRKVAAEEGWRTLFSGVGPRVLWIGMGGAIFLGSYEEYTRQLARRWGTSGDDDEAGGGR